MEFEIVFYTDEQGNSPIDRFLEDLGRTNPVLLRQTQIGIEKLRQKYNHRFPLTKAIGDDLYELRVGGKDIVRVLWFFMIDARIVLVEAFVKKTSEIPEVNRKRALQQRASFLARHRTSQQYRGINR